MNREKFTFEGLAPIEERIRRTAEEVGYLIVQDRTDRKNAETLGRFDLTEADAEAYLQDHEEDEPSDEEDSGLSSAFGEELDDEEPADEPEPTQPRPLSVLAEAAIRWVRDIARRNTVGEEWRRYRVKIYSPKGLRMIDSGQFVCRNHDHDLDTPALNESLPNLQIPTPTFDQASSQAAVKGLKALGDYYAQWGQIVLGSVGQFQGINNAMLGRLHRQLQESRGQVDQLIAAILETRIAEAKLTDERRAEDRASDTRTLLAQQALQQLGDAARAFLAAKGVNPEMTEVLSAIGGSPDLVAALTDPDVKALMNEPGNLKALAGMLKQTAIQARAMREATAPAAPAA